MTSFFKKRSARSRGSSYVDDVDRETAKNTFDNIGPPSSFHPDQTYITPPHSSGAGSDNGKDGSNPARMYSTSSRDSAPGSYPPTGRGPAMSSRAMPQNVPVPPQYDNDPPIDMGSPAPSSAKRDLASQGAPDLLTRAFNEAMRPYQDRISELEQQLADMQGWIDTMEQYQADMHAWIDKRGLRPDVPAPIAKEMDRSPEAATSLNAQLDRKITIVNFDLHRLQDDLNDSIPSAHFASAMAKFVPDIQRLSNLATGPRLAFELIIKLVGNLNSHGGLESSASPDVQDEDVEDDRRARAEFYERMDTELAKVTQRRIAEEGADFSVSREIKRLEKNGAYLRNLGIDSYFPQSLKLLKQTEAGGGGSSGGGRDMSSSSSRPQRPEDFGTQNGYAGQTQRPLRTGNTPPQQYSS